MSNPCLITGAGVYLAQQGVYLHGDLFTFAGCYVVNGVTNQHGEAAVQPMTLDQARQIKCIIFYYDDSAESHFERRGVFIAPVGLCELSKSAHDYIYGQKETS